MVCRFTKHPLTSVWATSLTCEVSAGEMGSKCRDGGKGKGGCYIRMSDQISLWTSTRPIIRNELIDLTVSIRALPPSFTDGSSTPPPPCLPLIAPRKSASAVSSRSPRATFRWELVTCNKKVQNCHMKKFVGDIKLIPQPLNHRFTIDPPLLPPPGASQKHPLRRRGHLGSATGRPGDASWQKNPGNKRANHQ